MMTIADFTVNIPRGVLEVYSETLPYYLETITYDTYILSASNGYWI